MERSYALLVHFTREMNIWESTSFGPIKGKPLSPFISKLKLLLNDEKYRRAIRWSENGDAIVITDGETFKKLVLDRSEEMFKTRNFTSFVRQLNLYGFRKVPVSGKADPSKNMKFEHSHFKRDKPELMHLVHRTCTSRKKKKSASTCTALKLDKGKYFARKCNTYTGAEGSSEVDEYGEGTEESFGESPHSTPNKDGSEFNHSHNSPFEVANNGNKALEDYMYQKFQEEQVAVQLLLNLRYSTPSPSCEGLQPPPQMQFDPTCYPMYPLYPTSPLYGQYNFY